LIVKEIVLVLRISKWLVRLAAVFITLVSLSAISITMLDDPVSRSMRETTESYINHNIEKLVEKSSKNELGWVDKCVLHAGVITGIVASRLSYPEASRLLSHYVYGDGANLELSSSYFKQSQYLMRIINKLGQGQHGPISLQQKEDWRLALTLNPYYLDISDKEVRLYHPNLRFYPVGGVAQVFTIVPIGKLRLKVYDSLVSALDPIPFYVYSKWEI
jgi:hypothetical protein